MGEDKLIGFRVSSTNHVAIKFKGRKVIQVGGISSNHGSVEIDIGKADMIENIASIAKIGDFENRKAEELEDVELGLGVAKNSEKTLELFEMIEIIAFGKDC